MTKTISIARWFLAPMVALFLVVAAQAATPGINGAGAVGTFNLTAGTGFLNQPDGSSVYSWGYGCVTDNATFLPAAIGRAQGANCPTMQVPGPTLIVTENTTVTINLTNNLPTPAGNTSILFPDFTVVASGGVPGLLAQEATPGGTVQYTFTATMPGTHAYYSGTQSDLQIEMGMYGAIIVLPASVPGNCTTGPATAAGGLPFAGANGTAESFWGESDFRLASSVTDHPKTCYDREYLFQWAEMDTNIHRTALAQVTALGSCTAGAVGCSLNVPTEPYHPAYFVINGRSMPDDMDPNYDGVYPHQPYNGNPHIHPGEQLLVRTIGQGRWQHPFHEHGNHVRILERDGNLVLSASSPTTDLAGSLMFNTDTTPGEAFDGIFYFTGRGLNWDPYGHTNSSFSGDASASLSCSADANGYNTGAPTAINYYEWCQDHFKPVEANPFGDVTGGGPATLPDPNIFTNGPWYGGTPYLGPDATVRAGSTLRPTNGYGSSAGCATNSMSGCTPLQPSNTQANPGNERGWAYMWHSHNEREITTNNVFPGGMLMMLLVDSREFVIDESL